MKSITINLTDTQFFGLEYVAADPLDWAQNFVNERARIATEEIVAITVEKCLETKVQLPGSKDEIVMLAFERGWIKTAADRQKEFENNRPA